MKRSSFAEMNCSVARTLDVIGEWWTPLVLREVFFGRRRFDEMQADLGIARNILVDRLNTLVEQGILDKRQYQDRPARFEYRLTERGVELYPVLVSLMQWGDKWMAGEGGPPIVLHHTTCGHDTEPYLACSHCHEPIEPRQMRPHRGPGWDGSAPGV